MEGAGGAASAPSLGLMKGVMLCNRPITRGAGGYNGPIIFKTGIPRERVHPSGRDPLLAVVDEAPVSPRNPVKQALLERQRALFETLTAQREALVRVAEEQQKRRDEKRRRVAEQAKAFRDMVRAQPVTSPDAAESPRAEEPAPSGGRTTEKAPKASAGSKEEEAKSPDRKHKHETAGANTKAKHKPAWAVSAATREKEEEEEAADLVDFARGLDFEGFVDAMDEKAEDNYINEHLSELAALEAKTQAQLEALTAQKAEKKLRRKKKKRSKRKAGDPMSAILSAIAADSGAAPTLPTAGPQTTVDASGVIVVDPRAEKPAPTAPQPVERAPADSADDESAGTASDDDTIGSSVDISDDEGRDTLGTLSSISSRRPVRVRAGDDAGTIATSILSSASSIRSVHSKASLTKLIDQHVQREKARIAAAVEAGQTDDHALPVPGGIEPPRIVVASETAGAHEGKKNLVNLLPFQRRNPIA